MSLIPYKNLYIVSPTTGDGGTALTNNFMTLADEIDDKAPSTDPVFAGKVGIDITPEYELDVNGDIRQSNVVTHTVTRTVPTTAGQAVDIGSLTLTNGSASLWISVTVASMSFSVVKQYLLSVQYTSSPENVWKLAMPVTDSGPYGSNEFVLEVKVDGAVASFRIRRASGTTAGTAYVVLRHEGVNTDEFTPSTGVTSGTAPSQVFGNTLFTQRRGNASFSAPVYMNSNALDMADGSGSGGGNIQMAGGSIYGANVVQANQLIGDGSSVTNVHAATADYACGAYNASYAGYASSAGYANYAGNAGYASGAASANYANTAGSASTASYADNAGATSYASCAGWASSAINANYASEAGHAATADTAITTYADSAGYASNASYASYADYANHASNSDHAGYADSAGYAGCAGFAYWLSGNHSSYSYGYALFMNNGGGSGGGVIYMDAGQIVSLRAENSPSAPASPNPGQIYFNTSNGHFYGWNGSSWVQLD